MLKKLLLFTLLITTPILAYAEWGQRLTDAFDVDKTAPTDTQALLWGSTNEIWAPGDVVTPTSGALTYLKLNQTTPQTITGGAPNFSSAIDFTQIATPANPPAGSNRLYFKNDDKLYQLTSGGSESLVGGGGGSSVSFGSAGQIPYTNATTDDFSYGTGLSWNPATSTLTATNITGDLTGNVTGNVSGNASTATSASSAASATNTANTAITDDTTTNAIMYPTWVTANTGNLPQKVSSTKLSFNPSSGLLTATGFSGPLTGNVTGNVSGNAGTVTNGVYTTDAGTVFLAPNGDGQNLSNVIHSESDPLSATKALDNIASCAINTSLLSDTADTDSLGSADKEWLNLYIGDAGKIYLGLGQDTSIHRSGANEMTLTASSGVKATNFISTASLGTSPYACTSNTLNTNLNADLLDGQHGTYYAVATDYLKLDQSTPQTVTGGAPNFSGGLDSGSSVNITGSADTVQLKVKANNPQVNDILQVLASDGTTKQFAIDGSGNLLFKTGQDIRPTSDSTTAINIAQADGTDWVTFDTTNKKIGINTTPTYKIDLRSDGVDVDSDFSISNSDYSHFIRLFPGRQSDPNPFILWKNGDPMRFVNDSGGWNELGRFSASGNLLVGTTDDDGTPATGKLVVKGSTNDGSTNVQVWRDSDEANVATLDTDGNFSGNKYTSSVAIGTQPYACTSTTLNTNLNADYLDGQHGSYYQTAITGTDTHVMFFDGANNPAGEAGMTYNKTTDALTLAGTLTVKGTTNDGSTNVQVWRDSDEANVATLDTNGKMSLTSDAVAVKPTATIVIASSTSRGKDAADYVCDGTNDEVQIQAAINALSSWAATPATFGGEIKLLEGHYSIGATITVDRAIQIVGCGSGQETVLELAAGADCDMFQLSPYDGHPFPLAKFADLMLDGNSANQSIATYAIDQADESAYDLYCVNVWFNDWKGSSIHLTADYDHRIERCVFENQTTYAIDLERVDAATDTAPFRMWITNCFAPTIYSHGAGTQLIQDLIINNNIFVPVFDDRTAINLSGIVNLTITNNTSQGETTTDNTYDWLIIDKATIPGNIVISNNTVRNGKWRYTVAFTGVNGSASDSIVISNNTFHADDGTTLIFNDANAVISGLVISNNSLITQNDDSMTTIDVGAANMPIISSNYFRDGLVGVDVSDATSDDALIYGNSFDGLTTDISVNGDAAHPSLVYGDKTSGTDTADFLIPNAGKIQLNSAGNDKNLTIGHNDTDGAYTVSSGSHNFTGVGTFDIQAVGTGCIGLSALQNYGSIDIKTYNGAGYVAGLRVTGSGAVQEVLPIGSSTGTINLGNATSYWADVSYKTLTDRGCLGFFDDGVELQDGRMVSDIESIKNIKVRDDGKKTIYGAPMLDYKTFPKVAYKPALKEGETEGIEMTSMFSIMLGAIKELDNKIILQQAEIDDLKVRISKLEQATEENIKGE